MSFILNIDTASEKAHVSFTKDGEVLGFLNSESQKEHASFLQSAIQLLIKSTGIGLKDLDAVAVTDGPGSYTGLRVGMASAKGLCYALKKPLITIGSLEILTQSAIRSFPDLHDSVLYCPMIDARRMEVFTALYQKNLSITLAPCALILDEISFEEPLSNNKIFFFGTGSAKWQSICNHPNASFENVPVLPESMSLLSYISFLEKKFTNLAYSEPLYLKEFQSFTKIKE